MIDVDVGGGTPGSRLHGNPMYSGPGDVHLHDVARGGAVGGAYNALDAYERLMRTKGTPLPPFGPRVKDREHQRWYGRH